MNSHEIDIKYEWQNEKHDTTNKLSPSMYAMLMQSRREGGPSREVGDAYQSVTPRFDKLIRDYNTSKKVLFTSFTSEEMIEWERDEKELRKLTTEMKDLKALIWGYKVYFLVFIVCEIFLYIYIHYSTHWLILACLIIAVLFSLCCMPFCIFDPHCRYFCCSR